LVVVILIDILSDVKPPPPIPEVVVRGIYPLLRKAATSTSTHRWLEALFETADQPGSLLSAIDHLPQAERNKERAKGIRVLAEQFIAGMARLAVQNGLDVGPAGESCQRGPGAGLRNLLAGHKARIEGELAKVSVERVLVAGRDPGTVSPQQLFPCGRLGFEVGGQVLPFR